MYLDPRVDIVSIQFPYDPYDNAVLKGSREKGLILSKLNTLTALKVIRPTLPSVNGLQAGFLRLMPRNSEEPPMYLEAQKILDDLNALLKNLIASGVECECDNP